jgi:anti-sigma regulatory factor (Ser/Thr protein kinase)
MTPTALRDRPMTTDVIDSAFTVPARFQSLAFIRSALSCVVERDPWASEETGRLLLAACEALSNAIEHGSAAGSVVSVRIRVDAHRVTMTVSDQGHPGRRPRLDLDAPPPPARSIRGRGIVIMRELADEMTVTPNGDGVSLTLVFLREGAPRAAVERRVRRAA